MGFLDSPLVRGAARSFGNTARANLAAEAQILAQLKSQDERSRGPINTIINSVNLPPDLDEETAISEIIKLRLNPNTLEQIAEKVVLGGMQKDNVIFMPDGEDVPGVKLGATGYRLSIPSLKPKNTTGKLSENQLEARALERWYNIVKGYGGGKINFNKAWGTLEPFDQERVYEVVYGTGAKYKLRQNLASSADLGFIVQSIKQVGVTTDPEIKITTKGYNYLEQLFKGNKDKLAELKAARQFNKNFIMINNKEIFLSQILIDSKPVTDLYQKTLLAHARGNFKASALVAQAENENNRDLEAMNKASSNNIPNTVTIGDDVKEIPDRLKSLINIKYSPMIIQKVLNRPENQGIEASTVIEDISNNLAEDHNVMYDAVYAILWNNWNLFLDQQEKVE